MSVGTKDSSNREVEDNAFDIDELRLVKESAYSLVDAITKHADRIHRENIRSSSKSDIDFTWLFGGFLCFCFSKIALKLKYRQQHWLNPDIIVTINKIIMKLIKISSGLSWSTKVEVFDRFKSINRGITNALRKIFIREMIGLHPGGGFE
jgi:hypothetical protein